MGKSFAMKKLAFKLRIAYRNLTGKNIFFSLAVFLLVIILLVLSILVFSFKPMIERVLYYQAKDRYLNIDLVMNYDENSTLKIINQRGIKEKYQNLFQYYVISYNFHSLIEHKNNPFYAQIFCSDITGFSRVIDYPVEYLGKNEVVIAKTAARDYDIALGDYITVYLGGAEYEYRVKSIIPDRGLFTDNAVFILKDELLREVIGPGLQNLGNTMYFKLNSGVNVEEVITALEEDEEYRQYSVQPVIDSTYIDYYANYGSSIFSAIGIIVIFALLLIIRSVFSLYFRDFNSQYAIINILGGNQLFAFEIWIYQLLILTVTALPVAILLCFGLLNIAARAFSVSRLIMIPILPVAAAVLFYLAILAFELFFRYRKLKKESLIGLSKEQETDRPLINLLATLLLSVFLILNNVLLPFGYGIKALINVLLSIALSVFILGYVLRFVSNLRFNKKKTVFNMFTVKYLRKSKIIRSSLKAMLISLILIASTLSIIRIFRENTDGIQQRIKGDYLLANVSDYTPQLKNDISNDYSIETVNETVLFQNVYIKNYDKNIHFFLSLEYDKIELYYDLKLDDVVRTKFNRTDKLYVVLPESLSYVYDADVGDTITMELSRSVGETEFIIAGFFSGEYESILFTNYLTYTGESAVNALFFNKGFDFSENDINEIIKRYSSSMYVLIDVNKTVIKSLSLIDKLIDYLLIIIWFIVGSFVVVIINNSLLLFSMIKADYAKLMILGFDYRQLRRNVLKEAVLTVFTAAVIAFVGLMFMFPNFSPMMVIFGYYKEIAVTGDEVIKYLGLGCIIFILSYFIYYRKIRSIRLIETIRKY